MSRPVPRRSNCLSGTLGDVTATEEFFNARDLLFQYRQDYALAYRDFRWPQLEEFNWALDVFDVQSRGNHARALWVVEEDGSETALSFAQLSARSNQVANYLRSLGVKRGERVLLMLPNCVPLWESMLAAIKLGAVIVPMTLLVTPEELTDRLQRGQVRHVIAAVSECHKFSAAPALLSRIVVGRSVRDWQQFEDAYLGSAHFITVEVTRASDPPGHCPGVRVAERIGGMAGHFGSPVDVRR